MVQLYYYEIRDKNCHRVLKYDGHPSKVLLFPYDYEGLSHPACDTYWVLDMPWWSQKQCNILEVCGTTETETKAKVVSSKNGNMCIVGRFEKSNISDQDFKLRLTTNVSDCDFQLGYYMTGTLERCDKRPDKRELTHFAMVKRKGY